jgi:putative redox protein
MEMIITMEGNAKVNAEFKGQIIKTDQPVMGGGDGTAPAPFDLFLASLGTCAGIYVKSFCDQRGIPTNDIRIVQKMEFDPAKRMIGKVTIDIQLPAGFPEKYKDAVINTADLCAVKRHLHDPPVIVTTATIG